MKKVIKNMCVIVLVVLAFTSCKKDETTNYTYGSTFKATIAPIEDPDEDRAYIDMHDPFRHIHFESDDVVMLFNYDKTTPTRSNCATYRPVEDDNGTGTFQNCNFGVVMEDRLDGFLAYYSGNVSTDGGMERHVITELSEGENKSKFFISPTQDYRTLEGEVAIPKDELYMVSKVENVDHLSDVNFTFKSLFGVLGIKLWDASGVKNVTQIQVYDLNMNLCGWVELIVPEFDYDEMVGFFNNYSDDPAYLAQLEEYKTRLGYNATDCSNHVTLNMPDGGVQIGNTQDTASQFYMVLRPLAMKDGAHLIVCYSTGEVKDVYIPAGTITMAPNTIKRIGVNLSNW